MPLEILLLQLRTCIKNFYCVAGTASRSLFRSSPSVYSQIFDFVHASVLSPGRHLQGQAGKRSCRGLLTLSRSQHSLLSLTRTWTTQCHKRLLVVVLSLLVLHLVLFAEEEPWTVQECGRDSTQCDRGGGTTTFCVVAQPIHHAPRVRQVLNLGDADSLPARVALSYARPAELHPRETGNTASKNQDDDKEDASTGAKPRPPAAETGRPEGAEDPPLPACPQETYRLSTGEVLDNFFRRYKELLFDIFRVRDSKWYLQHWPARGKEEIWFPEYLGGEGESQRLRERNALYDATRAEQRRSGPGRGDSSPSKNYYVAGTVGETTGKEISSKRLFFHASLDQFGSQQLDLSRWMRHLPQMSGAMQMILAHARKVCPLLTFVHEVLRLSDLVEHVANGIMYEMLRPPFHKRKELLREILELRRAYGGVLFPRNHTAMFPSTSTATSSNRGGATISAKKLSASSDLDLPRHQWKWQRPLPIYVRTDDPHFPLVMQAYGFLTFWASALQKHALPVDQPRRTRPVQAFATARVLTREFPGVVEHYAAGAECVERTQEMIELESRVAPFHSKDVNFFHLFMEGAADVMKIKTELAPFDRFGATDQTVNCDLLDIDRAWFFFQRRQTFPDATVEKAHNATAALFSAERARQQQEEAAFLEELTNSNGVEPARPEAGVSDVLPSSSSTTSERPPAEELDAAVEHILRDGKAQCKSEEPAYMEHVRTHMQEMINLVAYTDVTWLAQKCFPVLITNALHAALYTGTELLTALSSGRPWGETSKIQLLEFQALWDTMLRKWQTTVILPYQDGWAHRSVPQIASDVGSWAHLISQGYANLVSVADTILGGFDSRRELSIKHKRSKLSCAGVNEERKRENKPLVCQPMQSPDFNATAYDLELKEITLRAIEVFRRCNVAEWWPAGGTLIGALRYGSIVGDLTDGRQDVIDDDVDFVIGVNSPAEWIAVTEAVGAMLMHEFGFYDCYVAKSADQLDSKFFANIRDDMLTCGFYDPYYLQLDLRSYIRLGVLNAAYQHRLSGEGYEACDAEEDALSNPSQLVYSGNILSRVRPWTGKNNLSDRFSQQQLQGHLKIRKKQHQTLNPLCFLRDAPDFQVWTGQMPLDNFIHPLRNCSLYNQTVPCPHQAARLLELWNAREYENPEQCFALPHLAGRKVDHQDADPRNRKLQRLDASDVRLLIHYAKTLDAAGFQSFYPLYGNIEPSSSDIDSSDATQKSLLPLVLAPDGIKNGQQVLDEEAESFTHCAGIPLEKVLRNFQQICPPAKTRKGYSEYLVM
ncbi:unnamed protein product [Amoebophrya sp. A120]|nr:unnamed protein product [Amoebophrya sp. A120]|eukprot:GSA120T00011102001.1